MRFDRSGVSRYSFFRHQNGVTSVRQDGQVDVLSDVLRAVRLTGAVFFDNEAHCPWVASSPNSAAITAVMPGAEHVISFHSLLSGECWAEIPDDPTPPTRLRAGDIVIFPMGDANVLSSSPGMRGTVNLSIYKRPTDRALPVPYVLNQDASGHETCHFVCGYFGCDARPFNPLLDALPRMFVAEVSPASQNWLSNLIQVATKESEHGSAGGETMLAKLAELIFVEVVRKHIDRLPEDARGWFSGLRDRHVGTALRLIHARPAEAWTIEGLAREVGLSRSAFAERFTEYAQISPMHYLARWRMQLAARLLENRGISVAQAAAEVGYGSDAAFNRSFKKYLGVSPGAWRRSCFSTARL
jgi:AraC-like DNA-binding protein